MPIELAPTTVESGPPFDTYRFTVSEYRRLTETGILSSTQRLELLEGWIVPKMNHDPPHSVTVKLVESQLQSYLAESWFTRTQDAVTAGNSEPEPDIAIVRGTIRDFTSRHPAGRDTALIVEVADTSLRKDRYKCRVYAAAEFPVYWIVNLADRCVEVYSLPSGACEDPAYRQQQPFGLGEHIPVVLDGEVVGHVLVDELLA